MQHEKTHFMPWFYAAAVDQYVITVQLETLKRLPKDSIILAKNLRLRNIVGQGKHTAALYNSDILLWSVCNIGQFGLVYKGDWFMDVSGRPTTVAVKTLKGAHKCIQLIAWLDSAVLCHLKPYTKTSKNVILESIARNRLKHFWERALAWRCSSIPMSWVF